MFRAEFFKPRPFCLMLQQRLLIFKKIIKETRNWDDLLLDEYPKMHPGYIRRRLLSKTAFGGRAGLFRKAVQKFKSINKLKNNKFIMD